MDGFEWQNPRELAALQPYQLLLTGWMERLTPNNYTNATATAAEQAVNLKAALGGHQPVFSYQSAWLAAAFYDEVRQLMDDLDTYGDFFLLDANGRPLNDSTYCSQTQTTPAVHPNCLSFFWNWCNASAIDYYLQHVLQPLVAYPNGTGRAYDGVFLDNSDGFSTHGSSNAHCDAHNASMTVHIQTAKLFQKSNKWPVFSSTATGAGDVAEMDTLWAAGVGYTRFIEFFAPQAQDMANLYNETQRGLPTIVHAPTHVKRHPSISLNDSMAAFLVATGGASHSYFQYSSGWFDNNWMWSPLFAEKFGAATGPPVITRYGPDMMGEVWTRSFTSGAQVMVNCTPPALQGRFEWCKGTINLKL